MSRKRHQTVTVVNIFPPGWTQERFNEKLAEVCARLIAASDDPAAMTASLQAALFPNAPAADQDQHAT